MKKKSLKDIKKRNRQVILEAILEKGSLSRTEIAQVTDLAASTVSALTSELMAEGILTEAGTVSTAGRSRTELTIHPGYGVVAVVEIGRRAVHLTCYDSGLHPLQTQKICDQCSSGNELLGLITRNIRNFPVEYPPLVAIGLLFQEDMQDSDFRVMYSTGFSSATITLKEALMTHYKVPVEETYAIAYTVTDALQVQQPEANHWACISLGTKILTQVVVDGREVPLRQGAYEDLAAAMAESQPQPGRGFLDQLTNFVLLLCALFPLDVIWMTGSRFPEEGALQALAEQISQRLPAHLRPRVRTFQPPRQTDQGRAVAHQLLRRQLMGI